MLVLLTLAAIATAPRLAAHALAVQPSVQAPKADAPPPPEGKWTGSVSAGAMATDGNTDVKNASTTIDAELRNPKDRWTAGFIWNYSEQDGEVDQRHTEGKLKYDYFFTKQTYGLVQTSAENDFKSNLQSRWTLGAGIGRQFYERDDLKLNGEVGLTWFNEDYDDQPPDDYLAARLAYKVAWKPEERWELSQTAEAFPSVENSEDVYTKLDSRAKLALTENMFGQFQWIWDWDNTPPAGNERSDHRFLLTVGWKF